MAKKHDFELVEKGNELRFEKLNYDFHKEDGVPILGWVSKKYLLAWINHLNGAKNIYPIEIRNYNPDGLIIYLENNIIGWLEKARLKELHDRLFEYYKTKQAGRVVKVKDKVANKADKESIITKTVAKPKKKKVAKEQLCLF